MELNLSIVCKIRRWQLKLSFISLFHIVQTVSQVFWSLRQKHFNIAVKFIFSFTKWSIIITVTIPVIIINICHLWERCARTVWKVGYWLLILLLQH